MDKGREGWREGEREGYKYYHFFLSLFFLLIFFVMFLHLSSLSSLPHNQSLRKIRNDNNKMERRGQTFLSVSFFYTFITETEIQTSL